MDACVAYIRGQKLDKVQLEVEKDEAGFHEGRRYSKAGAKARERGSSRGGGRRASIEQASSASTEPTCWVLSTSRNGSPMWQNVLTAEIVYEVPRCWTNYNPSNAVWVPQQDELGMKYQNINTGEIIRQVGAEDTSLVEEEREARAKRESRKRKVAEVLAANVDESETALGKKVLDYTAEELAERAKGGMARFDFQKYLREYRLEEQEDGSSHLVRISNHAVCNKLTREETLVYRQNPHIQQVFANGQYNQTHCPCRC